MRFLPSILVLLASIVSANAAEKFACTAWTTRKYQQQEIAVPVEKKAFLPQKTLSPETPFVIRAEMLTISATNWMGVALDVPDKTDGGKFLLFRFCPLRNGKSAGQILLYDPAAGRHQVLSMRDLPETLPANRVVTMEIFRRSRTQYEAVLSDGKGKIYGRMHCAVSTRRTAGHPAFYSAAPGGMGALRMSARKLQERELVHDRADDSQYRGYWIQPENRAATNRVTFRKQFIVEKMPFTADIAVAAESVSRVFVNGKLVGETREWMEPQNFSVTRFLKTGGNVVEIEVRRSGKCPAMIADLSLWQTPEKTAVISSDDSWEFAAEKSSGYAMIVPSQTEKSGPAWGPLKRIYGGPLPEFSLRSADFPKAICGGEPFAARFAFENDPLAYGARQLTLAVEKNGTVYLSLYPQRKDGASFIYTIDAFPDYLPAGDYDVTLHRENTAEKKYLAGRLHFQNSRARTKTTQYLEGGKLYVDGVQTFFLGMLGRYPRYSTDEVRKFGTSINVCKVSFPLCAGWTEGEDRKIDFRKLDESILNVLSANPQVKLLVNAEIMPPKWYIEKYPDEQIGFADPIPAGDSRLHPYHRQKNISLLSGHFRRDVEARLSVLVKHLVDAPYSGRILGVSLFGGHTGEWMHWSSTHLPVHFSGYSKIARERFRIWLTQRYRSDEALQKAWRDTSVTLATASAPAKEEYLATAGNYPFLYKPKNEDFLQFYSEEVVETLKCFCAAIKKNSGGRYLTGVYYGYTLYLPRHAWMPMTGHCAMEKLLRTPEIDFVLSPYNYAMRGAGGDGMPMVCHSSLKLHNKMYIAEADVRTHLAVDTLMAKENVASTPAESSAIIKRDIASAAMLGNGLYWACVRQPTRHWFDSPEIRKADQEAFALTKQHLAELSKARSVSVAFFIDERAEFRLAPGSLLQKYLIAEQILTQMNRSGIGWDVYVLSDLEQAAKRYSVLVFPNLFFASAQTIRAIQKLKADGKTLIFQYAPAILNDAAERQMLTDFALEKCTYPRFAPENRQPELKDFAACRLSGADGEILLKDSRNRPLAVRKRGKDHQSIFIPELCLAPAEWRQLFAAIGIAPAAEDDDVVYVRGDFLLLHTSSGGTKTLRMPGWKNAEELFSGRIYPLNGGKFTFSAESGQTCWFRKREK